MAPQTFDTASDFYDAAREMAITGRPTLARLLAEEAANRTPDPEEAAHIVAQFPGATLRREA